MAETVKERIFALREQMRLRGISMYLIPSSDFHHSEYVDGYFMQMRYLTGFTGSDGTVLVTEEEVGLWTDARYFLQAEAELDESLVTLYRMGEEDVLTIEEYISAHLQKGDVLGFDARVVTAEEGWRFAQIARQKDAKLYTKEDLVDCIWTDRPPLSHQAAWIFPEEYAGETAREKIKRVREEMARSGADVFLLSSLTDIGWLLNLRGSDIDSVLVVLSHLALSADGAVLFIQKEAVTDEVRAYLADIGVQIRPYEDFYPFIENLSAEAGRQICDETCCRLLPPYVLLDPETISFLAVSLLPQGVRTVEKQNPTERMKACKNETEIACTRRVHLRDAVSVCRFLSWVKQNVGKIPMTEISSAERLHAFRAEQEGFLSDSFETICGFGPHGAIVHYAATKKTDVPIEPEGFFLIDSGGHYRDGSTDITRTIALGPLSREQKEQFTRVCCSMIDLARAKFLYGCTGKNLDILSREPLWEIGADYKHGTGHGVGHVLSVHEGPNNFRWRTSDVVLEEGMITSDEPGLYLTGRYGIRTENEILCRKAEKNEYGQFMEFETLTLVPIEREAILPEMMSAPQLAWLNDYHRRVYKEVSPYLSGDELAFLREATQPIG